MLFDLENYWFFLALCAIAYIALTRYAQNNVGGKGRLKELQLEIREVQKTMMDAGKNRNEKAVDEAIGKNWKLTGELMGIQMKMMAIILGVLFAFMLLF